VKIKGEVYHNKNLVPVEVEISENWLEQSSNVVHLPKSYVESSNNTHMISFEYDLEEK